MRLDSSVVEQRAVTPRALVQIQLEPLRDRNSIGRVSAF